MLDISSNSGDSFSLLSRKLRDSEGGFGDHVLAELVSCRCVYLLLMGSSTRGGCGSCEEVCSGGFKIEEEVAAIITIYII